MRKMRKTFLNKLKPLFRKMRRSGGWYLDLGMIRRKVEGGGCQCPLTFFAGLIGTGSFRAGAKKLNLTDLEQRYVLNAADFFGECTELRKKLLEAARL